MRKDMELKSEWIRENVNPHKVMESFLWFSFSKLSEGELVNNLKEFRDTFRKNLMNDEEDWIEKKTQDKWVKDEYLKDVKDVVDKETDKNMKHIQKMVKQLHLDKDSWKQRLGL